MSINNSWHKTTKVREEETMKRTVLAVVCAVVAAGLWCTVTTHAAIQGSKHDLGANGVTMPDGQLCIACHTPHGAKDSSDAPLWNHTLTNQTYTLYDSTTSTTLDAVTSQPTGVSKLCLSCHDGTVAIDAFTGTLGDGTNMLTGSGNLGLDLSKSHPVSFTFDAALIAKDGELKAPPAGWVNGGKFECSSCHDVHNKNNINKMLHVANASSALCLSCHVK
jgi:predicted CXXCH cytochrome family protein